MSRALSNGTLEAVRTVNGSRNWKTLRMMAVLLRAVLSDCETLSRSDILLGLEHTF
jgi:hypothetical protein